MTSRPKSLRTERLRALMLQHSLTDESLAELLGRSAATVKAWRVGTDRPIPAQTLELIELRLQAPADREQAA